MADPVVTPSMIPAVDPQGNLVNIPEEQIPLAQQQGFRPPTADEWAKHLEAVQYGGAGQAAIAGLEGAASGLTFGLAPLAERALGVSPEAMRARKEQNPVAHGVGEAIGVIAPIVATLGAAAPAEAAGQVAGRAAVAGAAKAAAEFTAPSLIAKAGQATAKLAESAGAGGVLKAAVGMGTEGALYSTADAVERAAMGDPDLTAEKVAGQVLVGALLGGAVGAGGKYLSDLIPKDATEKAAGWLQSFAGERNIKAAGAIQSDINKALKSKSEEGLNKIGQEFGERGLVGPLTTPAETLARAEALATAGQQEAAALTAAADSAPNAVRFAFDDFRAELEPALLEKLKSKASTLDAAKKLTDELDKLSSVYGGKELTLAETHALRQDVDALIGYGKKQLDPALRPVAGPLKQIRRTLDGMLEEGLERTNGSGAAWREAMRKQEVGLTAKTFAQRGMLRAQGNNLVSPTEFLGALGGGLGAGPVGALATGAATAMVRRHAAGTLGFVANRAQKVLLGVAESADAAIVRGVARLFEAGAAKGEAEAASNVVQLRDYPKAAERIQQVGSNVERMADLASQHTGPFDAHAPATVAAMNAAAARAFQHLNAKLPKSIGDRRPLDKPYQPSKGEIARFNRHYTITQNPSAVFEHIARGTLAPEHMETLQVVYPKLLEHTKAQVIEQMSAAIARGKDIPYRTRLMLSLYLGTDVDSTVDVATLQANQASYAQGQIAPTNTNGGAQSLSIAGRIATPMQSSAERTG